MISSPTGIIIFGGNRKPNSPLSLNSIQNEYLILATPLAQSSANPEAESNMANKKETIELINE